MRYANDGLECGAGVTNILPMFDDLFKINTDQPVNDTLIKHSVHTA